ncbi:RNA binding protein, putative, partial [Ixodes scapularis]
MAPGGPAEKKGNVLPLWGNEKTMNLNNLILTNILSSPYFKVNLYKLKTYHEVVDEIYYNVQHLEPWEKGSRKTSGQTGMCGGVRGVGAGGIVSTAFCILYKLFTLKLTRKQLNGLMNHCDSPYIRALGFMYIRFTQPPADLVDWYEPYLDDEEELDVKAGGGQTLRMGDMLRHFLTKLEWFATLFPRIPVPIQKEIERRLALHPPMAPAGAQRSRESDRSRDHERSRDTERSRESERARDSDRSRESDRHRHRGSPERRHVERPRDRSRERLREPSRDQRS